MAEEFEIAVADRVDAQLLEGTALIVQLSSSACP
jgi:hypothetical protein